MFLSNVYQIRFEVWKMHNHFKTELVWELSKICWVVWKTLVVFVTMSFGWACFMFQTPNTNKLDFNSNYRSSTFLRASDKHTLITFCISHHPRKRIWFAASSLMKMYYVNCIDSWRVPSWNLQQSIYHNNIFSPMNNILASVQWPTFSTLKD